ncbi:hypothetical protein [Brevundimonas sp. GCM10030266]|uniref:hypothetical protein n=1 Tax=Brevundimonas sp. GCM10030266 TaxID=3273386 RepID=UPI00361CCCBD
MRTRSAAEIERQRALRFNIAAILLVLGVLIAATSMYLRDNAAPDQLTLLAVTTFAGIAMIFIGLGGLFAFRRDLAEQVRDGEGSYRDRVQRHWVGALAVLPAGTLGLTLVAMIRAEEWLSGEDTSLSGVLLAGVAVVHLLIIPLMLMGWDGGYRKMKRLLDDELTRAYRASAITCAFWVLLVGIAGAYLLGLWNADAAVIAMPLVLWVAATTAALRFAQLHRRAEREMGADD